MTANDFSHMFESTMTSKEALYKETETEPRKESATPVCHLPSRIVKKGNVVKRLTATRHKKNKAPNPIKKPGDPRHPDKRPNEIVKNMEKSIHVIDE